MWKWTLILIASAHAAASSSQTLFHRLDPTSIQKQLAFYEIYHDTPQGQKALKQALSLLGSDHIPSLSFNALHATLDLFSGQNTATTKLSEQERATISRLGRHLLNRKLKGYGADRISELEPHEIDLGRALLISTQEDPETIASYEAMLDLMALQVLARVPFTASPQQKIEAINQLLFHEMHLRFPPHSLWANDIDVYTFLTDVLDSHRGVCLGVSSLYLCLAQRIGLELEIITPPGHIYVRSPEGINIETTARGIHLPDETYLGVQTKSLEQRTIKEVIGMAFFNQASTFWQADHIVDAIEAYEKARPFMTTDPLLQELLGYCYLINGQIKKGRKLLRPLRDYCPEYSVVPNTLIADILDHNVSINGIQALFKHVDETRDSILEKQSTLQHELSAYPRFRAGWFALAITYLQLGRQKEAIQALQTHNRLVPNDPTTHYYLAALFAERFDYPNAWLHLEQAESLNSNCKTIKELRRSLTLASPK